MSNKYGHNKTTKKKKGWNVAESTVEKDQAPQSRVNLNPKDFDTLIKQQGVNIKVYRSLYCPNVKSVDGAEHNIDCTSCNGSGFIDVDPICLKAVIQNQGLESMANVEGYVMGNTVAITFPIGAEIQYFTKIELADKSDIYYQRVKRKTGSTVDILKYKAKRVNVLITTTDRYYQDQDFKIDQNGNIDWSVGGRTPADGTVFSIHYETAIQFRAVSAMHANRFSQAKAENGIETIKMPEQWMCVKEFLVKRTDGNGNETPEGPYDDHTIVTDNS